MIIELPNTSAIESSTIQSVRWWPQDRYKDESIQANVTIESLIDGFERKTACTIVHCASDAEAQALARRVIDEWKQAAS